MSERAAISYSPTVTRRTDTEFSVRVRRVHSTFADTNVAAAFRADANNEWLKLNHLLGRTANPGPQTFPYTLPFKLEGPERLHYAFPIPLA